MPVNHVKLRAFVGGSEVGSEAVHRIAPSLAPLTDIERKRIAAHIVVDRARGCWLWDGDPRRYGKFSFRGKAWHAHRLLLELYRNEPLPPRAHVHHECGHKGCVNPAHLRALTPLQHAQRHAAHVGRRS